MFSKVIPTSSVVRKGNTNEAILYSLPSKDNQIVLSKDGILYMRSDKSGLIIDNTREKSEGIKKKEGGIFNKSTSSLELLFDFDKVYVCYSESDYYLFFFTRTQDNAIVYTEMQINDFERIEEYADNKNYSELIQFLYEIDESFGKDSDGFDIFSNENPITGKFVFSNGIDYARYYNSEVIVKNPFSDFNKNRIESLTREFKTPKKYSFKTDGVSQGEESDAKENPLVDKIIQTVQNESDFEDGSPDGEDGSYFFITSSMRNSLIVTGIDSLEIYDFYIIYNGEDSYIVEYQKLDIGKISDIKNVFSNFQLK